MNDDGRLTWPEAREFLRVGYNNPAKYRCPHQVKNKHYYYTMQDLLAYKERLKKRASHLSHSKGKDGIQALARTIIMFALVESENPVVVCGDFSGDAAEEAKEFLSKENWYTELLEELAEWPDFFRACRRHFQKGGAHADDE